VEHLEVEVGALPGLRLLPRLEPDPPADLVGRSLAGPSQVALDLELQERVVPSGSARA